jgi:hypothetical protein
MVSNESENQSSVLVAQWEPTCAILDTVYIAGSQHAHKGCLDNSVLSP